MSFKLSRLIYLHICLIKIVKKYIEGQKQKIFGVKFSIFIKKRLMNHLCMKMKFLLLIFFFYNKLTIMAFF